MADTLQYTKTPGGPEYKVQIGSLSNINWEYIQAPRGSGLPWDYFRKPKLEVWMWRGSLVLVGFLALLAGFPLFGILPR